MCQVILINSANYTAWDLRWRCLQALPPAHMVREAAYLERMLDLNPKNYQLWNYRRRFALHRGAAHAPEVRLWLTCQPAPAAAEPAQRLIFF